MLPDTGTDKHTENDEYEPEMVAEKTELRSMQPATNDGSKIEQHEQYYGAKRR